MSVGNKYNVIVDGSLLVSKSAIVNGQITSSNMKSLGDIVSSSYSLNTLGDIIKPSLIDTNTNYGKQTLNLNYNNGSYNSCLGYNSMYSNLSGTYNSVIGYKSLYSNTSGNNNTGIGYNVFYSNTSGHNNTGIGSNSLYSNTSGNNNIGIGMNSFYFNKFGNSNIAIGASSLYNNVSGNSNIGIGYNALCNNTNGSTNVAIGDYSMGNTTQLNLINNIGIGYNTLYNNQANDNIGIGVSSLYSNTTGSKNIGIGSGVLNLNQIGSFNIGVGLNTLNKVVSGNRNIGIGAETLKFNVSDDNIGIGNNTLYTNTSGIKNIGIGTNTLYNNASGQNNVAIGYESLKGNTYGSYNIAIGYQSNTTNQTNMSTISIGTGVSPSANNQLLIGNGGYDSILNISSLFVGKNNYTVNNYYTTINGSTNISGSTKINGDVITIGTTNSNVSLISSTMNLSSSNFSIYSNNINIGTTNSNTSLISSILNLSVPKIGCCTTSPSGTLHIYESVGSGDLSTFTFNILGGNPNGSIYAIAVDSNNNVYVGGRFTSINGVSANNIAKWTSSTSSWSAMGTGITDSANSGTGTNIAVHALAVDLNDNLYVGGRFDKANGTTVNNIAKYISSTSTWSAMGTGTVGVRDGADVASNAYVYGIAINSSNNVFFVGKFYKINSSISVSNVTLWNNTNSTLNGVGPGAGYYGVTGTVVYAIAIDSNNNVYVGGDFTSVCSGINTTVNVSNIAYISSTLTSWSGVGTSGITGGTTPTVYALTLDSSNNVYVGGDFTTAGGSAANNIAKWNGSAWSSIIYNSNNGTSGLVRCIDVDNNNDVYFGGNFTTAGGLTVNNLAKWNVANSTWSSYIYNNNTGITGGTIPIRAIINRNNINYLGGDFTSVLGNLDIDYFTYFNTDYSYYNNVSFNTSNGARSIGTLVLDHGNVGGCSSIIFPSAKDRGNEYAYIQYRDNINDGTSTHYGRLEIGVENDYTTDALILQKNGGYVGIGKNTPAYTLDVNGIINVTGTTTTMSAGGMIKISPYINGGESSIGFYQKSLNRGPNWVVGHNTAGAGSDTFGIYSNTKGGNVATFLNNGNVGIGTSSPGSTLHINGTVRLDGNQIEINPSGTNIWSSWYNTYGLRIGWNKTVGEGMVGYCCHGQGGTGGHEFWTITSSNTTPVSAKVQASTFNATSDYRIKKNITKINDTSYNNLFYKLNPLYYLNEHKNHNDFGFLAHEVQELYPDLVDGIKDGNNFQVLNYSGLIPLCVNEIHKQNKIIEEFKEELRELRSLISQNK